MWWPKKPGFFIEKIISGPKSRLVAFKIASEEWEFAQIHRLNYKTFVEEIPQRQPNTNQTLVGKFNDENTYLICLCGDQLLGMAAIRDKRPFSLDEKLENLDAYLPPPRAVCELRLLVVKKVSEPTDFPGACANVGAKL